MSRRYRTVLLGTLVASVLVVAGCGQRRACSPRPPCARVRAKEKPRPRRCPLPRIRYRIVFNGEITGSLVYDTALVKKGIRTALKMLGDRIADWSIDVQEIDNKSDPLLAVEQSPRAGGDGVTNGDTKRKVRDPVDFICGPLSSSNAAAVSYFLSQRVEERERVPQCSVTAQPKENITTSGGVGFIPNGIYSSHGYYLGKFAAETLHFQTANCIHYADRIAEEIQSGFERGFTAGGGTHLEPDLRAVQYGRLQPILRGDAGGRLHHVLGTRDRSGTVCSAVREFRAERPAAGSSVEQLPANRILSTWRHWA